MQPDAVSYLVVHCSDTPDDEPLSAVDIHAMHLGFGWHGIGYHYVVTRDGTLEPGRPEYWIGAHVYGFNPESLGVCLIGRNQFTDAQFSTLAQLLMSWRERYPKALICGHRDFEYTEKTCPNFDVAAWCHENNIQAQPGLTRPSSTPPA
ncbi:MAG: N-acetylmuramoyl-L-alanine amidase [Gammaproteobacteria bacterium]|nr:N-acetylmuramoyl-L-alanine amidase [Gammaproteobacteria bacterium]